MGIWIRQSVPETIPFIMNNALKPRDFKQFFHDARQNHMNYLTMIAVIWLGTASTYLLYIYFPIHLSTIRHIPYSQSLIINTVSIALLVICIPVFSYFSERWERRKVILLATVGYLVLALPYYLILSYGNLTAIFIAQLSSAFISALFYGMAPAIIAESAPPTIRCTMTSVI